MGNRNVNKNDRRNKKYNVEKAMRQRERKEEEIKKSQPYTNMYQDGILKVVQGLTSLEEVFRVMKS